MGELSKFQGDLKVVGSVSIGDNTNAPSSNNVGSIKYVATTSTSKVYICMQTGSATYTWIELTSMNQSWIPA